MPWHLAEEEVKMILEALKKHHTDRAKRLLDLLEEHPDMTEWFIMTEKKPRILLRLNLLGRRFSVAY